VVRYYCGTSIVLFLFEICTLWLFHNEVITFVFMWLLAGHFDKHPTVQYYKTINQK